MLKVCAPNLPFTHANVESVRCCRCLVYVCMCDICTLSQNTHKAYTSELSNHPINPITYLNPRAENFIPISFHKKILLNPYAIGFLPELNSFTTNVVLKPSLNLYAKVFTPTYKSCKIVLNSNTKAFVPRHLALYGIHVMSVILVIILILTILVLGVSSNPTKQYVYELPPKKHFKKLKIADPNKLLIVHLNINSIRYKFEYLKNIIDNNVDILLISGTKLDNTFPNGQFLMNSFHLPFRKDRTEKGGGYYYIYMNMYLAERWLP